MNTVRAALIGTGFIAPVHLEALRRVNVDVVAVLGSNPEKARQFAAAHRIRRVCETLADLLVEKDVQVVHITSPNDAHFAQASACINAGKHVVCEKPLAINSTDSAALVAAAERSSVVCAVCYNIRFYPLCLEARTRIASGELGAIYHITGSYMQDWLLRETDFNWRVLADRAGALRAVADIGTHWLDLISTITGLEIEAVCADLKTFLPVRRRPCGSIETFQANPGTPNDTVLVDIDTEDYGSILLRFKGGASGVCTVSQVCSGRKNCLRWEIAGARSSMAWNSESPNELWLGNRDQANAVLLRDPALLHPQVRSFADYPGGHNEGFPDTFKQLFRAIYRYISTGDYQAPRLFPTFADGHREVVLCEAVLRSRREQCWVSV